MTFLPCRRSKLSALPRRTTNKILRGLIFSHALSLAASVIGGFAVVLLLRRHHFFGPGTLTGGVLGKTFDNSVRTVLWTWRQQQLQKEFRTQMGYAVPRTAEETNLVGVPVVTDAWLRETVLTSWRRQQQYERATIRAIKNHVPDSQSMNCSMLSLVQPLMGDWYRPLAEYHEEQHVPSEPLCVDESTMDAFMYQHYAPLVALYQSFDLQERAQLWALCHVADYGGIFIGPFRQSIDTPRADDCIIHFRVESNLQGDLDLLQAPPRQAQLVCVLRLLVKKALDGHRFEWKDVVAWLVSLATDQAATGHSTILSDNHCLTGVKDVPFFTIMHTLDMQHMQRNQEVVAARQKRQSRSSRDRWKVTIIKPTKPELDNTGSKRSWGRVMQERGCFPGWLCHRCLRLPWFGSHLKCRRWFCPACYHSSVCNGSGSTSEKKLEVDVEVQLLEYRNSSSTKRIPSIIHQTWFEELTALEYPHLQRLQNSWKSMQGWEYRFYTDITAREFIQEYFPALFLEAYDAILVPAFKADYFRLCLLAKLGGVYADVDVMLETNLDYFITSDLSFFVSRDVNIDMWPDANYCVWNGLMGSSPGHPVVIKALEDLVNRALHRQDYLDIEGDLCRRNMAAEVWKLRCSPMLLVTGPCALGISLSDATGRSNPLAGWHLGWQSTEHLSDRCEPSDVDWGHILILLLDRYDLGEQRFIDIGRNLLIASTNQDRIATRSIHDSVSEHKHYSSYESDIVGSRVYRDDQVNDESVRLQIKHQYT